MRLPYESWANTLRKLGLRIRKTGRALPAHRRPRNSQLEVLERREVMAAEIDVQDSTMMSIPDETGTYSFGSTMVAMAITKTFTIKNTGMDSLSIDTGSFSLPSGFTLTQPPASSVAGMGQTSFTVRLDATTEGPYSGQLSFANGDTDESPYNFAISGTVTGSGGGISPEIEVRNSASSVIFDGSGSESLGTTTVGTPISKTFTIKNTGTSMLTVNSTGFSLPSGFTLTQSPSSTVMGPGETTFTVRLDANTAGPYSGDLSFGNSDSNENPYNFTISGTVNSASPAPEIEVRNSASSVILDGSGSESFGTTAVGAAVEKTFTIKNTGTDTLTVTAASLTVPSGFTVVQAPPAALPRAPRRRSPCGWMRQRPVPTPGNCRFRTTTRTRIPTTFRSAARWKCRSRWT
jgi:archaellum component FlaG (FlaF/FlaG flagellin family)